MTKVTTLGELRQALADQPDEMPVVVQVSREGGHSMHAVTLQPRGHVGFDGVIIHVGERIVDEVSAVRKT